MMLQYPGIAKFRTKKIVFEDVIPTFDFATLQNAKELSSKRRDIQESINNTTSVTPAIARETSFGLTSPYQQECLRLEQYIPWFKNLISQVLPISPERHKWISQLKIQWSSTLSRSSFFNIGTKFFQVNDLWFELGMMLFLYGALLRERAWEILSQDLKQSAFVFRQAAGVFKYLAREVLPYLCYIKSEEMPAEATVGMSNVMVLLCLADAQAVYIRKAEETGSTTGVGVLAKLYCGVANMLKEALPPSRYAAKKCGGISSQFLDFISSCVALYELRSQRYFAERLMNESRIGTAIAVLRNALSIVTKKFVMPAKGSLRDVLTKEIENVTDRLKKFERENAFVWGEKISVMSEIPSLQESRIVKIEPYHPQKLETKLAFKIQIV